MDIKALCPVCGRINGVHIVREWKRCMWFLRISRTASVAGTLPFTVGVA